MFSGKDPDQLIYVAEAEISRAEHKVANTEPPWDGFCGLVKICDDEPFKERGVTRIAQPTSHRTSATFAHIALFPGQHDQAATSLLSHPSPPAASSHSLTATAATQNPAGPHPPHVTAATTHHAPADQQQEQQGQGTVSPTASSMSAASEDMPFWVIDYVVAASSSGEDSSSPGSPASWVNDLPSPPQDTPLMPS